MAAGAGLQPYGLVAGQITGELDGDGSGVRVAVLDSGSFAHALLEGVAASHLDLVGLGVDGPGRGMVPLLRPFLPARRAWRLVRSSWWCGFWMLRGRA